ncbi:hypothetical protein ACFL9U_17580, partial [Thermodesulfobacteriota bacterium]
MDADYQSKGMLEQGFIQVYTSESDKMNFAPIGLCMRASGHNFRTFFMNFTPSESMERITQNCGPLKPNLTIEHRRKDNMRHKNSDMASTYL